MAKSQIIKDLANGNVDIQTALKRTKVLLQELDDEMLLKWINSEIEGYSDLDILPEYRIITGELYGQYLKGSMARHMKYNNVVIPLGNFTEEQKREILTAEITQGISTLKEMIEKNEHGLIKPIPPELYPYIAHANDDPYMYITYASVRLNIPQILNIFPKVENKLLDILSYLEKQFGNLDDLDIDIESKTEDELKNVINNISIMLYNDKSVTVGDGNKISNSEIASSIEK